MFGSTEAGAHVRKSHHGLPQGDLVSLQDGSDITKKAEDRTLTQECWLLVYQVSERRVTFYNNL